MTLDERGWVTFYRDGSGGVAEEFVDRIEVAHVRGHDRCWRFVRRGAGLWLPRLPGIMSSPSCRVSGTPGWGAQRCTGAELDVFVSVADTERQILAAYGPRS